MLGVVLASLLEGTFECNAVTLSPHSTGDTTRQAHVQGPAVASEWWFAGETSPRGMCTWSVARSSRCCKFLALAVSSRGGDRCCTASVLKEIFAV